MALAIIDLNGTRVTVRMKPHQSFDRAFDKFCSARSMPSMTAFSGVAWSPSHTDIVRKAVVFKFKGQCVEDSATPGQLGMATGNEISVHQVKALQILPCHLSPPPTPPVPGSPPS